MSTDSIQTDVFKFVALRPPVSIDKKNQDTNIISDSRQPVQTLVGNLVKSFYAKDGTKIPEQVRKFIADNKYDLSFPEDKGDFSLSKIYDFVIAIKKEDFKSDVLENGVINILDSKVSDFIESTNFKNERDDLWDRYYAFYILSKFENLNIGSLAKNLRVLHLLQFIANSEINDFEKLQQAISATISIPELFISLPAPLIKTEKPAKDKPNPETINEYKNLWNQLIDTHRAIDQIKTIKFDTNVVTTTKEITIPNKETGIELKSKLFNATSNIAINKKSFDSLHQNTKSLLKDFNLSNSFQIAEPILQLQEKAQNLYRIASNIIDPNFFDVMPTEAKAYPILMDLGKSYLLEKPNLFLPFIIQNNIRNLIKPLGIGDLKVVKQTLKKYVAGEVAHIENVLRGEYKERKHRVLDRTEDIFSVSNETNEETTKDTQTTERFELKKESEKTIQEQMSVQAGVTVSGSYGMVTFGAHGDFAYSTASSESNKSASNFAREVIDKSVSKIQKKTKEERTTKKLHEVEEINTHGIDNKEKPDHAVGIYRWVDKHYEAQIYNYGKRMMFEFIIPEPAAFYEFANTHKQKGNIIAPKPLPEGFNHKMIGFDVLNPDTTRKFFNYEQLISDYNVQGVTPPPLHHKTITVCLTKDSMPLDGNPHTENKQLIVPAGYISRHGIWWDLSAYWTHYPIIEVTLGNKIFRPLELPDRKLWNNGFETRFPMGNNHDNHSIPYHQFLPETPIQISINCYDTLSYTLNAYAYVVRTNESFETWQIQTFEKIKTAYYAMQVEYEQKLAAQEYQKGVAITGQNPLINREIEKTELKKHCLKMLMDKSLYGSFNAMYNKPTPAPESVAPDFDIFDALDEGKKIQFFEQAFEWENLTYLFYSYFWARKDQWVHKSTIYDNDPLFTKFLQAGSARVVLPVRPGYNDVVAYYMQTGDVWGEDGNPPKIEEKDRKINPLFLSIADELRNQTDDLAKAKPEGEPWEVILPTTLVWLQKDSDLPTF